MILPRLEPTPMLYRKGATISYPKLDAVTGASAIKEKMNGGKVRIVYKLM